MSFLGLQGQGFAAQSLNSPVKTQYQINFAAPGALNTDVVGVDQDTGINFFTPLRNNIITDVEHTLDPAAGLVFTLFTRRTNFRRTALGRSGNFNTTFDGEIRSGFPKALGAGFFQFVEQQQAGALTAQNYVVTTIRPLTT